MIAGVSVSHCMQAVTDVAVTNDHYSLYVKSFASTSFTPHGFLALSPIEPHQAVEDIRRT